MEKNNKGFMLAELIIVSTVVVVGMVGLYANFSKVYSLYKEKYNYYSVDGVYATKEIVNSLMNSNFNRFVNSALETGHSKYLIANGNCEYSSDICEPIKNLYHVKNMIFVEYSKDALGEIKGQLEGNVLFKDYIDYVIRYYGIGSDDRYSYIVLTEIEDSEKRYYSNLGIR